MEIKLIYINWQTPVSNKLKKNIDKAFSLYTPILHPVMYHFVVLLFDRHHNNLQINTAILLY
jgi:hypothetical protein